MLPDNGSAPRQSAPRLVTRRVALTGATLTAILAAGAGTWASAATRQDTQPAPQQPRHSASERSAHVHDAESLPAAPVILSEGTKLVVHLSEPAGTRYTWSASVGGTGLSRAEETLTPPAEPKPGGASDHVFTFRASRTGTAHLTCALATSTGDTARTVRIDATVSRRRTPSDAPRQVIYVHAPQDLPAGAVTARTGDLLMISLDEQAGSTGFSWSPATLPAGFRLVEEATVPGARMPGSVGQHVFTIQVTRPGSADLTFTLARPWEHDPADRVSLAIAVRS
ncbi:MAG TPA: protease inhibitor I42 family protein [Kineosporiaceae bacterium]